MTAILKELIVILIIAAAVFKLAKPIALLFSTERDFSRRRVVWFTLTIAAFLLPSFWLFTLVAIPVLISTGRKDSNPGALYLLLLQVIPPITVEVPMPGLSHLVEIDINILLSLFVLVPAAFRLSRLKGRPGIRGLKTMDVMLLAYGILSVFLFLHPEDSQGVVWQFTIGSGLRRAFSFFVGVYIPYFVISRSASNRRKIIEDMAALCLSCGLMAAIALFESARHWLVYADLPSYWGYDSLINLYYTRSESVRAMASAGHPLALGYLLEIAFGFWLYLQSHSTSKGVRFGVSLLLWLGLIATYSRGPWIGAACIFFVFSALKPGALRALTKAAAIAALAAIVVSYSPLGDKIINMLPFFGGSAGNPSLDYRHQLLERSWQIIMQSPWLGDQNALLKMQDLRQGEGIIDVVNGYVEVLLSTGFVGLSLLLGFMLVGLLKSFGMCKRVTTTDRTLSTLGASLVSCILGTLIMMMDGSFGGAIERMFYVLAALAAAYVYLGQSRQQGVVDSPLLAHTGKPA
jgi:O-antigen ligase